MKLPCSAMLALAGFLLIVPPLQKDDNSRADLMAPFGQWVVQQRYDTEEACFQGRDKVMEQGSANLDKMQDSGEDRQRISALCINSEDPRLTEK